MIKLSGSRFTQIMPDNMASQVETQAFAYAVGKQIERMCAYSDSARTYAAIETMPEYLLDYMAVELRTPSYDESYSVKIKRELIQGGLMLYTQMGTRGAVESALSAIYPGTSVEEWFEYGGDPYYFRIIIDVTEQRAELSNDEILRAVDMYKSLRSHLEEGGITYRSRVHIVVGTAWGYAIYNARRCGTYPQAATRGGMARELVVVETAEGRAVYSAPMTGETVTGTHPQTATRGGAGEGGLTFTETAGSAGVYARPCGSPPGAL